MSDSESSPSQLPERAGKEMEDIAIIGMACRLPGDAHSTQGLWDVLKSQKSTWSEFPKERFNIDGFYHPDSSRQGSIPFRGAHLLKEDIQAFDAAFFSISGEEAKAIDPQQRLALEVSYEALENAGIRKEDIDGSDASVFISSFVKDYEQICLRDPDWQPKYAASGNSVALLSNRISYFYNLHGPSITVDTACSGSLLAIHLAVQSLRSGESSLSLVGGASVILTPNTMMPMAALNFLSPDGKCFSFDARANGYGRGEGAGILILKRLSDAIRSNDTIRAVIRGTAANQDGRTAGITLPSAKAQAANIRKVYSSIGIGFDQTAFVECHGTGTPVGDPIEVKGIADTLGADRTPGNPITIGSVKTNIGHLEAAAGVAGVIKAILALEKAMIPANINFETPNPAIDFDKSGVKVATCMQPWPTHYDIRRVSVNGFGFGGTNCHVILDDASGYLSQRSLHGNHNSTLPESSSRGGRFEFVDGEDYQAGTADEQIEDYLPEVTQSHLLLYSASDKSSLVRSVHAHAEYLERMKSVKEPVSLDDYAYTLASRRSALEFKTWAVGSSTDEITNHLKAVSEAGCNRSTPDKMPAICFVFAGQGSIWTAMGRSLLCFAAFLESIKRASHYMLSTLGAHFDLAKELGNKDAGPEIFEPWFAQVATTALQVAMVDLMVSFNILPRYVVGHSSGEIAAAYATSAITREQAWSIAYYRGVLAEEVPLRNFGLGGGMLAVGMSEPEALTYLASRNEQVEVACVNGPQSVTLSGVDKDIDSIQEDLKAKNTFHRRLNIPVAYHSSQMQCIQADYWRELNHLGLLPGHKDGAPEMFSSLTGSRVNPSDLGVSYWVQNLVRPVRFSDALRALMSAAPAGQKPDIFIELSPSSALRSAVLATVSENDPSGGAQSPPQYLSLLKASEEGVSRALQVVGTCWASGVPVTTSLAKSLSARSPGEMPKCLVDVPSYHWNHERKFWHRSHAEKSHRERESGRRDLVGAITEDSNDFECKWRHFLRVDENPWILHHKIQTAILYPAAGVIAMVIEAMKQRFSQQAKDHNISEFQLLGLKLEAALLVPHDNYGLEVVLQIRTPPQAGNIGRQSSIHEFELLSKSLHGPWRRNASGNVHLCSPSEGWSAANAGHGQTFDNLSKTCTQSISPHQFYEQLDVVGINYGYLFRNIVSLSRSDHACVASIQIPDTKSAMPSNFEFPHIIHPATMDSMFQTLLAFADDPMVPHYIERVSVAADLTGGTPGICFHGFATAEKSSLRGIVGTIAMTADNWSPPQVVMEGIRFTKISHPDVGQNTFLPNHRSLTSEIVWGPDTATIKSRDLKDIIPILAHKNPRFSILQIGADAEVAKNILGLLKGSDNNLPPRLTRYTISEHEAGEVFEDLSRSFAETSISQFLEKKPLTETGEGFPTYNLVIVGTGYSVDCSRLRSRLFPHGLLLLQTKDAETTDHSSSADSLPLFSSVQGRVKLYRDQFRYMVACRDLAGPEIRGVVLLVHPSSHVVLRDWLHSIIQCFLEIGLDLDVRDWTTVLPSVEGKICIIATSLDEKIEIDGSEWDEPTFHCFKALRKLSSGILWVSKTAVVDVNAKVTSFLGLARTLMSEDPSKRIVTLGLHSCPLLKADESAKIVRTVFEESFRFRERDGLVDTEYTEDDGQLFIPRLQPLHRLNALIHPGDSKDMTENVKVGDRQHYLELQTEDVGVDHGGVYWHRSLNMSTLAPDDVEIEFRAAPLHALDLEILQQGTSEEPLGLDIFGIVSAVGSIVRGIRPGDSVAGLTSQGSLRNRLRIHQGHVKRVILAPDGASLPYIPSCYVSALRAFSLRANRTQKPIRSVLISAGASAYGRAAIQVTRQTAPSAEVYTTVLGKSSDRQRTILLQLGIPGDRILDGNSDAFVRVLRRLAPLGMDMVYNTTQENIEASMNCVREGGLVVQLWYPSLSQRRLRTPLHIGSFEVVNLPLLLREEPQLIAKLQSSVARLLNGHDQVGMVDATNHPLPCIKEALEALREDPYCDLHVLTASSETTVPVRKPDEPDPLDEVITTNGTYVIAGGLSGLGGSIAKLLVEKGAKNIVSLSRSGTKNIEAKAQISAFWARGVWAVSLDVDICDRAALAKCLEACLREKGMPPIRGVVQCAAVLRDSVFENMTYEDWISVLRPKIDGSRNLLDTMQRTGPDSPWFILLSSASGIVGNRGQANYAAANTYQDALARHFSHRGRRVTSLALGPVLGAGMLTRSEGVLDSLRGSGFFGVRHEDFLTIVGRAIAGAAAPGVPLPPQIIVGVGTGGLIEQNKPIDPYWSRKAIYSYLNIVDLPSPDLSAAPRTAEPCVELQDITVQLKACTSPLEAAPVITLGLVRYLARTLHVATEAIDGSRPMSSYGVDSLVAVGVRNWVKAHCGVEVSVFEVLGETPLHSFVECIAGKRFEESPQGSRA